MKILKCALASLSFVFSLTATAGVSQGATPLPELKKELVHQMISSFGIFAAVDSVSDQDLQELFSDHGDKAAACAQLGGAANAVQTYLNFSKYSPASFTAAELTEVQKLEDVLDFASDLCGSDKNDFKGLRDAVAAVGNAVKEIL